MAAAHAACSLHELWSLTKPIQFFWYPQAAAAGFEKGAAPASVTQEDMTAMKDELSDFAEVCNILVEELGF